MAKKKDQAKPDPSDLNSDTDSLEKVDQAQPDPSFLDSDTDSSEKVDQPKPDPSSLDYDTDSSEKNRKDKEDLPSADLQPEADTSVWYALAVFCILVGGLVLALNADIADAVVTFPVDEVKPSERERVEMVVERSLALRARGDFDQAYAVLMEVHNEVPEDPQINLELARVYLEKEDHGLFPFAEDYLILAAEKLPRSAKIAFYRGVLVMRKGEELLRRGRLASSRGQDWVGTITRSDGHFRKARMFFVSATAKPSPYNLAKSRQFEARCVQRLVDNALAAALTYRKLAKGSFGVNLATLGLALKRLQVALNIPSLTSEQREGLSSCKAELERIR